MQVIANHRAKFNMSSVFVVTLAPENSMHAIGHNTPVKNDFSDLFVKMTMQKENKKTKYHYSVNIE